MAFNQESHTLSGEDLRFVSAYVLERSGIVLGESKRYLVESRVSALARALNISSPAALIKRVRAGETALGKQLIDQMTTNETFFFRDVHPFEALREHVLPKVMDARRREKSIRVWSGACSTGQEAYSIALVMLEHFPELADWDVLIEGSDISAKVVAKANNGVYSQLEVERGLPPHMLADYFVEQPPMWRVSGKVRKLVRFETMNLLGQWPLRCKFDIIFLRYVLIYLDDNGKRRVLRQIENLLPPHGYLFLGSSESPMNLTDAFVPVLFGKAVCYQLRSGNTGT